MRDLRFPNLRQPRSTTIVAVLAAALAATSVLAWEANSAEQSHRRAAESALNDYAEFAAWEFASRARDRVAGATSMVLTAPHDAANVQRHLGHGTMPNPDVMHRAATAADACGCAAALAAQYYFRVDLPARTLIIDGSRPAATVERWITDTLADVALASPTSNGDQFLTTRTIDDTVYTVAYTVVGTVGRGSPVLFGFGFNLQGAGRNLFDPVLRDAHLLPPSLTRGAPNDSLVSVTVAAPSGKLIYQSGPTAGLRYVGADTLAARYGGLVVRAMINSSVAPRLVIGGVPPSRLAWLLGWLGGVTLLLGFAVWQLRREQHLTRLREDFVSSVSHELRTPLTQILMDAETLRLGRTRSEDERIEAMEAIFREAGRLKQLVENVLHFGGSNVRGVAPVREPALLAPIVRETVDAFGPIAGSMGMRVRFQGTDCEDVIGFVDRGSVRQILLNLLDNAVKYGREGQSVTVNLEHVDATAPNSRARIVVDDEGPGVPASDRSRIWERFVRLDRKPGSTTTGSGLGLAVVRDLVTQHGGAVFVGDAPQGGARFVIELPAARAEGGTFDSGASSEFARPIA